ncbi:metalloregulator ArsR/SmtB family transcription factor [Kibdelosporangium philippinense]|uniref:Metalloregulator ArsR/SmtB family transcription factor n=1 Tax=Kibdelosporangium philippinense TaxID=211113 RepID=A0ABS8ZIM2_9PSEU|nr:metalloregulator ArsR/SmtB family transcription factor [Kibdelosporangium philippinense]MCE7007412.1 metalloregulator ArsR/SmtB family transcription factor [Kibdelosporangium philippinense]
MVDLVAGAIADPVRREILELLRAGPLPAGEIAGRFTITRPAISRHLRVLRESGLVRDETVGRQRMYALEPAALGELAAWIASMVAAPVWEQRLDALETEVYRTRRERREQHEAHPNRKTGSDG